MPGDSFVHLHLHTEYSLLDGAVRTKEVMKKAVELEMPAVAITDHGNLFGAIDFYQAATDAGIKPIIGCEAYITTGNYKEKGGAERGSTFHFTLLAQNEVGYHNLVKLVSAAHLDGFYHRPRIDKELLAAHASGLIGMSGCLASEINSALSGGNVEKAQKITAEYRDIFGPENFFIELHDHGIAEQKICNAHLPKFAKDFGLGLVAANDVHFLRRSDHKAHDVLMCINTGAKVEDERRMRYEPELYFKTPAEMREIFRDFPDAITNTLAIAERCNLTLEFGKSKYPEYPAPEGKTREGYLRELCYKGLHERYGERATTDAELIRRLDYEVDVLTTQGFVSYFLIVWDFIHFAKQRGIPVGPGRGSAAGSIAAYCLGITDIDPLQYGLIFERFLNPERISPPDIDVDFCEARRGEVLEYVRKKYGDRRVSQIITFGKLKARSVVRDVGRVMGFSYRDADRIAKMIPNELGITLSGAVEKNPELKRAVATEPPTKQLMEFATALEGLSRSSGVHAAGVVIGDRDLSDYVPLTRDKEGAEIVSQYAMGPLNDLGLLKMDFLGLKTLTVIEDAVTLIRKRVPDFSLKNIPLDDASTFALFNRGETIGIFQMESGGMTSVSKQFDVRKIDDIIALIALYRPGPMELIGDYIKRKKGLTKIRYEHPLLEEICADTYGVMIYQEQVMAAANKLAGYSLGSADVLRRAMGKKDKEKMAKERVNFIAGCEATNGIGEKKANAIFDLLEKFAGYGFNKSHSAAYGLISYQTAYLKANYPVEFMAGLLSNEINNTDKISVLVAECKRMGMTILPPDVNRSSLKFLPEEHGDAVAIRFGLAAVKHVGEGAMEVTIAERERGGDFKSLEDFCARLDSRIANRKMLEALVKAGAFDFLQRERAEVFACIDDALASASAMQRDRAAGQVSLFGDAPEEVALARARKVEPWSDREKMTYEKELLGFYVSGHPFDAYAVVIAEGKFQTIASLNELSDRAHFRVAGAIAQVDKKFTKKESKPFAVIWIEDLTGTLEVVIWNEVYAQCAEKLVPGNVIAVRGKLDLRDESLRATAEKVRILSTEPKGERTEDLPPLRLHFAANAGRDELGEVRDLLNAAPGQRAVQLIFHAADGSTKEMTTNCRVRWSPALEEQLQRWLSPSSADAITEPVAAE
ncbi:MAG: DNA polymerase III subunit alpha [Verrucomicrobiota bacterium]|nr:DNA polymerase III subunit alpha [Verrucomicrobiota bacterium]